MRWIVLAVAAAASPAVAKPTFLSCNVATQQGALQFNVTPDKSAQAVTYDAPSTGYSAHRPAVFSATSISFDVPLTIGVVAFEISRSDLSVMRTINVSGSPQVDHGTCTLQVVPKRAF